MLLDRLALKKLELRSESFIDEDLKQVDDALLCSSQANGNADGTSVVPYGVKLWY